MGERTLSAGEVSAPAGLALAGADGATRAATPASQQYLFGPTIDLVIIGGGLSLIVIPFAMLVSPAFGAVVFMVLNLVCNYPHYMATNYRVYGSRAQIRRYRVFAVYATTLILLVAIASHVMVGPWVNLLVVAYLFLGPYHYTGQNYGIALMYARRAGIDVSQAEKRLLYGAGIAFMLTYLLLITVRPMEITPPALMRLQIPADTARVVHLALLGLGLACASIVLWRLSRRAPLRAVAPVMILIAAQFVWFAVPSTLVFFNKHLWAAGIQLALFVPAINFLHSAQYLGVTTYYTKRERESAAQPFSVAQYILVLVVGGAVLWSVGMRVFSEAFLVDYALTVLVLNALINIHHYVLDGAIWKLRDGRIARLLVAPAAAEPAPVEPAPSPAPQATWWGQPRGRLVWAAVAIVAVAVFAADTMRGYMLLQAGGLQAEQKWQDAKEFYSAALRYNANTADAKAGLAIAEMQAGNLQQAADLWQESIRLNPLSSRLRDGLGETYLKLGRVSEALEQLEQAVAMTPTDELGLRLLAQANWMNGNRDQARALMERADTVAAEANRKRLAL